MIKTLYKIFLALIISLFVGFGINVFYEGPKPPAYNDSIDYQKDDCLTTEQLAERKTIDGELESYQEKLNTQNRNVSVIAIIFSIILLVLSLTVLTKNKLWGDGVLLGGLLTLVYGIIRGMASMESKYQFIAVSIGLAIALILGYYKFGKDVHNKSE